MKQLRWWCACIDVTHRNGGAVTRQTTGHDQTLGPVSPSQNVQQQSHICIGQQASMISDVSDAMINIESDVEAWVANV